MVETIWYENANWSNFWGQLTIELIGGFLSSLIFLYFVLLLFKPKVKIAPVLCKKNIAGQIYYSFKFVNTSFFAAYEVKVELFRIKKIPMGKGNYNSEYKNLILLNSNISIIRARKRFWQEDRTYHHCLTVRTMEDIESILADEYQGVCVRVSLKHGLTGLPGVFEQEYGTQQDLRIGKFEPGGKFTQIVDHVN